MIILNHLHWMTWTKCFGLGLFFFSFLALFYTHFCCPQFPQLSLPLLHCFLTWNCSEPTHAKNNHHAPSTLPWKQTSCTELQRSPTAAHEAVQHVTSSCSTVDTARHAPADAHQILPKQDRLSQCSVWEPVVGLLLQTHREDPCMPLQVREADRSD